MLKLIQKQNKTPDHITNNQTHKAKSIKIKDVSAILRTRTELENVTNEKSDKQCLC